MLRLSLNIKFISMLCLAIDMVHHNTFLKAIMNDDVKTGDVKDDVKSVYVEVDAKPIAA